MVEIRHSLRTWVFLFLINGLVLCGGFLLLIQQSLSVLEQTAQTQTEQNLKTFSYSFKTLIPDPSVNLDNFLKDVAQHNPGFRVTVINQNGTVIGDSDAEDISKLENHKFRSEVKAALSGKEGKFVRQSTVNTGEVMYYAIPIKYDGQNMALRLSMPVAQSVYFSSDESDIMIITSIIVLLIILLVSFLVSAHIVRQIGDLQKATDQYTKGNFDYALSIHSPREFEELGISVQRMAHQIKHNFTEISQQRDEFEAVFTGINEGLVVFDKNMNVQEYNQTAAFLFQTDFDINNDENDSPLTLAQLVRNSEIIRLANTEVQNNNKVIANDINEKMKLSGVGTGIEAELHINAETHIVNARCIRIKGKNENNLFLLVLNDITRNKHLEQVRKDFVANVSHELKTPVTSIKGFTETLLDGAVDDKDTSRHFLEIIDSQSSRLMNIIEDLLTLSRLEQNKEPLELSEANILVAVHQVCENFEQEAERKHISIKFIKPEKEEGYEANINEGLFSQAIGNLLDNAIKYCPEKSEVTCTVLTEVIANDKKILITVEDNGKGILPVYRERIFERFFRVDKGRSRETGGTGLGLSIVSHIIQMHGGSVKCTTREDSQNGARFEIRLPFKN